MTERLALVDLATETVLRVFSARAKSVDTPTGERIEAPRAGWRGGGELTYADALFDAATGSPVEGEPGEGVKTATRKVGVVGPARYVICPVKAGKVASGRQATGEAAIYTYDPAKELAVETVPSRAVPLDETKADLVALVKAEAGARIVAFAPEWRQRNLTAQAVLLADKGRANWTAEELSAWNAGKALWDRVAAVRAASDAIEAAIAAATTHGGAQAAYEAGEWPE